MLEFDPYAAGDPESLETRKQFDKPLNFTKRESKREFVSGLKKEALEALIPVLPPPNTDMYIVSNGLGAEIKHGINWKAFDFGTFIPHLVKIMGNKNCGVYLSTWSINAMHNKSINELLDSGAIGNIMVTTDNSFKARQPAIYSELVTILQSHNQRFLAFSNHCKILMVTNTSGATCVITSSANLSSQPRAEQYVLTTSPDVYQFFKQEFFEAIWQLNHQNQTTRS